MVFVTVTDIVKDEGSLVLFLGVDEDGTRVEFACEHRYAEAIYYALHDGSDEPVVCNVEDYQVVRAWG